MHRYRRVHLFRACRRKSSGGKKEEGRKKAVATQSNDIKGSRFWKEVNDSWRKSDCGFTYYVRYRLNLTSSFVSQCDVRGTIFSKWSKVNRLPKELDYRYAKNVFLNRFPRFISSLVLGFSDRKIDLSSTKRKLINYFKIYFPFLFPLLPDFPQT